MNESALNSELPDIESLVDRTGGGSRVNYRTAQFREFIRAVTRALDAPSESDAAQWLRSGIEAMARAKNVDWSTMSIWSEGLREALENKAETQLQNNSDLASPAELKEELWLLFIDHWAEQYLKTLEARDAAVPLWSYVEARWLDHLRDQRKRRSEKKSELGILFVHGIGNQKQGETLEQFGRPLIEWFGHRVSVREASLRTGNPAETPAHTVIDMPGGASSWTLAESWWAEQFSMPPFAQLAGWLVTRGPSLALAHLGKWSGLKMKRAFAWLRPPPEKKWLLWSVSAPAMLGVGAFGTVATVIGSFVLTVLLQLVALVLGILSLIPILRSRAAIATVLLSLRSILGDSFTFVDNPLSRSAILTRVRSDLKWLSARCAHVAVIAHSQGAAVAHNVLRKDVPPNTELLITVGSGLGKLERAYADGRTAMQRCVSWVVPTMPLFVWFAPQLVELGSLVLWIGAFYFVTYLTALTAAFTHLSKKELSLQPIHWVDYYASNDPVPNGPLVSNRAAGWVESHEVHNYGSILSDHTSYFKNRDEFVTAVLRDIGKHIGSESLPSDLDRAANYCRRSRTVRVRILRIVRVAALVAWIGGGFLADSALKDWGVAGAELESSVLNTDLLTTTVRSVRAWSAQLPVQAEDIANVVYSGAGWILLGLGILPFFLLGRWIWQLWDRSETRATSGLLRSGSHPEVERSLVDVDAFVALVPYVLALAATAALIVLDLAGWLETALVVSVLLLAMMALIKTRFERDWRGDLQSNSLQRSYVTILLSTIGLMLWIGLQAGSQGSLDQPYLELWTGASFIWQKVLESPEAFAPTILVFGLPVVEAIAGMLND